MRLNVYFRRLKKYKFLISFGMTNHLQEQAEAETHQDNSQSIAGAQHDENQSIMNDAADDNNSESVGEQYLESAAEPIHIDMESDAMETTTEEAEHLLEVENPVEQLEMDVVEDEENSCFETGEETGEELAPEPVIPRKPDVDYASFTRSELVELLRQLLDKNDTDAIRKDVVDAIKFQFYRKLKAEEELKRAEYIENGGTDDNYVYEEDEQELILKNLLSRYREIRNAQTEVLEADKQKNLEEKFKIIEELKELAKSSDSISGTFQNFRELQNRWRAIGLVPQSEVKNLWDTYHHYVELFYDYIKINKDLRDLDFKRNLEAKIKLCEKTEALLFETSVVDAFRQLQTYHEQWREIGPVPQEMRVEIWERFKAVSSQINKKHQGYFDNLKEIQKKNKEAKEALCTKIEEIIQRPMNSSNQWRKNSLEIIEIQKLWNTLGHVNKKDDYKLFKRFHSLCNNFFNLKREFTDHEKEEQNNNLQLKQDLCVQAEALKDSTEWKTTTEEFIQLQNKWKEIGGVPPKYHESVWKRFRKACDYFFEQKSRYFSSVDSEYDNNLKAKQALIEQIKKFEQSKNPQDSFEQLKEFQRQWSEIGYVPIKHKKKIQDEYRDVINKQFDSLRMDDSERNRLRYKNKIETMVSVPKSRGKLDFERDRLMRKFQQLQSDLVVWENNIGFFSKSKKSEAMVASVQSMIEQGKAEMQELEEKIRIIDSVNDTKA